MEEEWQSFEEMWEQRFLQVAIDYLDPAPKMLEGSGLAEFTDQTTLVAVVEMGEEVAPRMGYFRCNVIIEYDYDRAEDRQQISRTWGQILEAFGNGRGGGQPLRERLTLGRLQIPKGIDTILYDGGVTSEGNVRQFEFTAHLGILSHKAEEQPVPDGLSEPAAMI